MPKNALQEPLERSKKMNYPAVEIAPAKTCSQCAHFVSFATTSVEQCDGACFLFMDSAGSSDPIATICKGYRASAIVEVKS